jgi:DNA-binding transcriptional regulator YhcF (GntR family)
VRTSRRSGSVVARGPAEPPTPGFSAGWTDRLRTLLAEAVAHGMPDQSIHDTADSLLAEFAARRSDRGRSAS